MFVSNFNNVTYCLLLSSTVDCSHMLREPVKPEQNPLTRMYIITGLNVYNIIYLYIMLSFIVCQLSLNLHKTTLLDHF